MLKRLFLMGLAISLATGCQNPISGTAEDAHERPVERMSDRGILTLRILWPDVVSRQVQVVPVAARKAVFTVTAASGDVVATRTVTREGGADVSFNLELAPGDDYSVVAELFDAQADLLASGKSAPFRILRQRASTVELAPAAIVSRFAGTGTSGYDANDSQASEAKLWAPVGLAADGRGNMFIAELSNHIVRKVDAQGQISTVAGTGKASSGVPSLGDNGPASAATLNRPSALALAANGDLFIADAFNRAIRLLPATSGERYGQTLTPGHLHTVHYDAIPDPVPHSVAVDAGGNVFFSESARIRMLALNGKVTTVAGNGTSGEENAGDGPALEVPLNNPDGLMVDPSGNLLFTERNSPRVRMLCRATGVYFGIPMASGSVYAIAGKGIAPTDPLALEDGKDGLEATFNGPRGLALDARGNLYISDFVNPRIRRLTPDRRIFTLAGSGKASVALAPEVGDGGSALLATFRNPVGLAVHGEMLYVADSNNHRVRRIPL
ncbi:Serine/threonine-protein kinase PknD [compost metagenome]